MANITSQANSSTAALALPARMPANPGVRLRLGCVSVRRSVRSVVVLSQLVALGASTGVIACAYDFDKFSGNQDTLAGGRAAFGGSDASGGEAAQQGGTSSIVLNTGGVLSTGGTLSTGGAPSGGGTSGMISPTGGTAGLAGSTGTTACAGVRYSGICWYLGAQGSSCQQVCTDHGQPATNAASYIGTTTQGGSISQCKTLLGLLGINSAPVNGTRSDGRGLGCHWFTKTTAWWLSAPNFNAASSEANSQLVCGCTQ
jgi:hypothetical protein